MENTDRENRELDGEKNKKYMESYTENNGRVHAGT